jgi:hypothetical protein
MANEFTQLGANLKLVINNHTIGLVSGFSYSIDYGRKSLRGIDDPFAQEIVSGQQTLRGTVNCIRIKGDSLERRGIVRNQVQSGSVLDVTGVKNPVSTDLLAEAYLSIALIDRSSGEVVFQADRALVTTQNWSVGPRGIMTGSFDFEAIVQLPSG